MAIRTLSQTLLRHSPAPPFGLVSPTLRHRSSRSGKLVEVDIDPSPSTSSPSERDGLKMRKLEEAIQAMFVERSTPDWLPFRPGSSFWVPPRKRNQDVADLVGRLWQTSREEEALNFTSGCGRPDLEFFSGKADSAPENVVEIEVEVQVSKDDVEAKVLNGADNDSKPEDRE